MEVDQNVQVDTIRHYHYFEGYVAWLEVVGTL